MIIERKKKIKKMSILNEQYTLHSHPAPACHHVLARQERSPRRHVPPHESGSIPKEQCASGNTVSKVGEERGLVTQCIIHIQIVFKPPLMPTYLIYRNKLFSFYVFRFLLEMAEELISLKVRLKSRFETIETVDVSNMKGNLIPQFGSRNSK